MKIATLFSAILLGLGISAQAAIDTGSWSSGFQNSGNVPDGNLSGWSDTRSLPTPTVGSITAITITLNVSGGYNGDLYGYLSYGGSKVELLNRVGTGTGVNPVLTFGYSDSGMTITLKDSGALGNIHTYGGGGPPSGEYAPDSGGASLNTTFGGQNDNGQWTLFLADRSGGGGTSQVISWGLEVTGIPEPMNMALAVFGAVLGVTALVKSRKLKAESGN